MKSGIKMMAAKLMIALLLVTLPGCAELTGGDHAESQQREQVETEKTAAYLDHYFDIVEREWDKASWGDALRAIVGEDWEGGPEEEGSMAMLRSAVDAAGYRELVGTYTEESMEARAKVLKFNGLKKEHYQAEGETFSDAAYVLSALDSGLISAEDAKHVLKNEALDPEVAQSLLMNVASLSGNGRHSMGMTDDPEAATRLRNYWDSVILFSDAALTEVGRSAVEAETITGFNVKNTLLDARFLPEYTLQYGHDNIQHALQLLSLMRREGLVAEMQLEPKVSTYQYLLEWGPVPEATPTYRVEKFDNDLYLVFAVEYDLKFEFDSKDDMMAFDQAVKAYAKKNEGNEEGKGLLVSSWWQPLYSTVVQGLDEASYRAIDELTVEHDNYRLHSFVLPEDSEKTMEEIKRMDAAKDLMVEKTSRFCNEAFYHYLKGEDFQ